MGQFIRDFQIDFVETFPLDSAKECHEIFKINNDNLNFEVLYIILGNIGKNIDEFSILFDSPQIDIDCMILTEICQIPHKNLFIL